MARKLEQSKGSDGGEHPILGRRGYVKIGMLSTILGGALVGQTATASADARETIHIAGSGSLATYDLTVTGELSDDAATPFDAAENISGRNAEGTVRDGVHGYRFDGEIADLQVGGSAEVYHNGERIDLRSP